MFRHTGGRTAVLCAPAAHGWVLSQLTSAPKHSPRIVKKNPSDDQWEELMRVNGLVCPAPPIALVPTNNSPGDDEALWPVGFGVGYLYTLSPDGLADGKRVWVASAALAVDETGSQIAVVSPYNEFILGQALHVVHAVVAVRRPNGERVPVYIPGPLVGDQPLTGWRSYVGV